MRIIQIFIYILLAGVGGFLLAKIGEFDNAGFDEYAEIASIALMAQGCLFVILQTVFAFVGNKSKGCNIASIVIGAIHIVLWVILFAIFYNAQIYYTYLIFAFLGIFGIIGGAQGLRHGIFPEKQLNAGYACRLSQAILDIVCAGPFFGCCCLFLDTSYHSHNTIGVVFVLLGVMLTLFAIMQFIFAFKGKHSRGANVGSVVINALMVLGLVGLPGFIGGLQGIKYLKAHPEIVAAREKNNKVNTLHAASQASNGADDVTSPSLDTVDYSITDDSGEILLLSSNPNIVDFVRAAMSDGNVDAHSVSIFAPDGDELDAQVAAYKVEQRGDTNRLYIVVKAMSDKDSEGEILCLFYVVQLLNGDYGLVREHDKEMLAKIHSWLEALVTGNKPVENGGSKFKRFFVKYVKSWLSAIVDMSKETFKFLGNAASDTDVVKAFKRGYNGEGEEMQAYTVRNEMGCEETIYSSDGKLFYRENGEFVGESNDGGKTIIWR